jgi:hypothetical protein
MNIISCGTLPSKFEIMGGSNRDSASCLYTGSVEGNSESLGINFRPYFKIKIKEKLNYLRR